jgi:DNA invertase Pin-like site-specific DNA recombinase
MGVDRGSPQRRNQPIQGGHEHTPFPTPCAQTACARALTDTLVVDTDGVYDLKDFNDRLLLGLKGQMSEAELHMITSRLQGAKRAAAERGELRFPLPVGYVHDEDGETIIDLDQEVEAAIRDLFRAFEQTGSGYGVVGAFKGRRFPKRAYGGAWAGRCGGAS